MGEGYEPWKKRSGDKAKNLGEWNYGDQFYTAHVLRYYSPAAIAESGVVNYAKHYLAVLINGGIRTE